MPSSPATSYLKPWHRVLLSVLLGLGLFVAANTIYLVLNRLADAISAGPGAAPPHLTTTLQVMVLSHTGAGLLLALLVVLFVVAHLPRIWTLRSPESLVSGGLALAAMAGLLVTGLFILTAAASQANQWARWLHVGAALLLPLAYLRHRWVSYSRPSPASFRRFAGGTAALLVVAVAVHAVEWAGAPDAGPTAASSGAGDRHTFQPVALPPVESPFYPAAVTTSSGGPVDPALLLPDGSLDAEEAVAAEARLRGFVEERTLGAGQCARCHADIAEQWSRSAHRFSSFNNPFYEASFDELRASATASNAWIDAHRRAVADSLTGASAVRSRFCGACHDPAVALTGAMDREVDRASVEAQAGLTCMACHAIDGIHGVTGNGNYNLNAGATDPYIFSDAPAGSPGAFLHDAALRARPSTHRATLRKPVFGSSEYCASCHKVSIPEAVNDYRWLRGQNLYDGWHDSGISLNAARTFYLPESRRECQDCHMPPVPALLGDLAARNGTVRSHEFLAANTALPFIRGDTAFLRRTEAYLQAGKLRVEVFALRRPAGPSGDSLHMALESSRQPLLAGESVGVDVVVRNTGVGHPFPAGTNDSNQGWIEFSVVGADGRLVWQSGAVGADGHLDPMAHAYGAVLVDRTGRPIDRRNAQDIRVAAAARVIGPGTADVAHYVVRIPPELAGEEVTVRARLLWRKFTRAFTEFAWAANPEGFARFPGVPELPVTEIARHEVILPVVHRGEAVSSGDAARTSEADRLAPLWMRYNDYGIGLLLEGNTRLATAAFTRVDELAPGRIDGPLNLARTALAAGDLDQAYRHLEAVEARTGGDARAAWVWARVLQEDGRYDEAELAYRRVLRDFPGDRGAWRNLGQTLYLNGDPEGALAALDEALTIDPEDRIAHYYRMLALRVAGRDAEARVAGEAFRYYGIDESARELTREFRARNPGVNLMAQPIHTHHQPGTAGGGG